MNSPPKKRKVLDHYFSRIIISAISAINKGPLHIKTHGMEFH